MDIIVPAAGLSTRFPEMKPKYLLYDYKGELMIHNAIRPFLDKHKIHIGILKEHNEKYNAIEVLTHEFGDKVNIVVLEEPTKGPADTVYQIINKAGLHLSAILIKDCDSFFDHEMSIGNYVCVTNIAKHESIRKLGAKSFVIYNDQGIITDIVEKEVVSDTFCIGGYKFNNAMTFKSAYEKLSTTREVFVSDVISYCIGYGQVFTIKETENYVDVGTAAEWFEYNDKPVIFCDIDGTIVKNQGRVGENNYNDPVIPLQKNIDRLLQLQSQGAQFIFTTARDNEYSSKTREMLYSLGFKSFTLLCGLQNARRILINDYNSTNPYPRAEAINLKRDSDNLSDFL
jgi:choline kinase